MTNPVPVLPRLRIGEGWDIHALVAGRPLILGGVVIEHSHGLLGHSDADALCHAITDALFGAAALGDIGQHFPDTDQAFRGADSIVLLGEAARRVSPQTCTDHPEIPWAGIIGFRNVLAHVYGAIDYRRLYAVVAEGVPALIVALEAILESLEEHCLNENIRGQSRINSNIRDNCALPPIP